MKISPDQIKNLLSQAKDLKISGVTYENSKYYIANGNLNCHFDKWHNMRLHLKKTKIAHGHYGCSKIDWESLSNIETLKNMFWCELQRIEKEIEQKLMGNSISSNSTTTSTHLKTIISNLPVSNSSIAEIPIFLYFACLITPVALTFLVFKSFIVFGPLLVAMLASLYIAKALHKRQLKELKESTIEAKSALLDKNLEDINKILEVEEAKS